MGSSKNAHLRRALASVVLVGIGLCFLLPLLWLVVAAFDNNAGLAIAAPELSLHNLAAVVQDGGVVRSFRNGLLLSVGQATLVVSTGSLAAYALSRTAWRRRDLFLYAILIASSLPVTVLMVPVYQQFVFMRLIDSLWGTMLFLTATSLPYAIWMLKSFLDNVPRELEEAAWIDGATVIQALWRVVVPMMLPGLMAVGVFTFVQSWGNFFVPYILLQSPEKLPASVVLYQFFGQYGMVDYGKLAAFCILYTLPAVVLYVTGQRYMQEGFRSGAVKG